MDFVLNAILVYSVVNIDQKSCNKIKGLIQTEIAPPPPPPPPPHTHTHPARRVTYSTCIYCHFLVDWKGSIVYNWAKVYIHQKILKVVVNVIITDQWNQTASCRKSKLWLFIAALFLLLWRQSTVQWGSPVKPGLGHWQTLQTKITHHRMRRLIRVCTVLLNYRKLRVKSPFRTISLPIFRDNRPTSAVSALIFFFCFSKSFFLFCLLFPWFYSIYLFVLFILHVRLSIK